jgi:GlpG protein
MRLIGHLKSESSAKTLGDYLVSLDIRNLVEPDAEGWAVWIYSEDQIDAGREALTRYLNNPGDAKFQHASENAAVITERKRLEKAKFDKRVRSADRIWASSGTGPATLTLMLICIGVTLIYMVNPASPVIDWLVISEKFGGFLPEVRQGQIWRLITPIFIHFGWMHIIFNMWMLRDMGSLVESRRGVKVYLLLVLFLAIASNLGQYIYSGPGFGGISGVLYGLFGYIWLRGQCDPASGLHLHSSTVSALLIWFFLCLVGIIPGVANVCHAVGLVMGMIIGAAPLVKRAI